jgi:hypothetical protein
MLHLAPAAAAEDGTKRLNALRRRLRELYQVRHSILWFNCYDANARVLLRQGPETKNDYAAGSADGLSVGKEIGEDEIEFCAGINADRQAF